MARSISVHRISESPPPTLRPLVQRLPSLTTSTTWTRLKIMTSLASLTPRLTSPKRPRSLAARQHYEENHLLPIQSLDPLPQSKSPPLRPSRKAKQQPVVPLRAGRLANIMAPAGTAFRSPAAQAAAAKKPETILIPDSDDELDVPTYADSSDDGQPARGTSNQPNSSVKNLQQAPR